MKTRIQALQMGDFSDKDVLQIEELLSQFDSQQQFHHLYVRPKEDSHADFERITMLLEESLADSLTVVIKELLVCLSDADPERVFKAPSWLQRMTGKALENSLCYLQARARINFLLKEADQSAARIELLLTEISRQRRQLADECHDLRLQLVAGRLYLSHDSSQCSALDETLVESDFSEQLSRKMTNLAVLLSSHEMTAVHLEMVGAQMGDLLAHYYQSSRVLVPLWRESTLNLLLNQQNDPAQAHLVRQAYQAVKNEFRAIRLHE